MQNKEQAKELFDKTIKNGSALEKFKEIIIAQGGNPDVIKDYSLFNLGKNIKEIKAQKSGYIKELTALEVARCAKLLGAGRDKKSDSIDFGAGVVLEKKIGDSVLEDETIAKLYYGEINNEKLNSAIEAINNAVKISQEKVEEPKLIVS